MRGLRRGLIPSGLALLAVAGCGGAGDGTATSTAAATTAAERAPERPPRLRPPTCPAGDDGCERASGQVAYVERVDPDGDGDAHFVLISDESITAPGISVIDVAPALRPDRLPRPGDMLAAAGPVYEGSFGQRQIEAVAVRFERAR